MRAVQYRAGNFALLAILAVATAGAQDSTQVWKKTLVGQASGAQAGFSNWAEGGVNTVAITLAIDGTGERTGARWLQKHDVRFSFGLVRQDTLDVRKAEDLIRLRSSFQYTAGDGVLASFQPTLAATFRSQFAPGKNFDEDPLGSGRVLPVKVSDLFAPATFTQTLGLTYTPAAWFTQRLGVAAKETVVTIERLRPLYSVDLDKSFRAELGIEAFSQFDREIASNVHYKSTLGLFAAFNQTDAPDLIWENAVAMKVNSWLGVNFEWTMIYDADVASEIQLKEVFSIGLSYIFV
jgi:DUF3078 family protein